MPIDLLLPIALGLALGVVVAFAVFVADLAARRLVHIGTLLDVVLRLSVFGVIVLSASELVGSFFGSLVRTHAIAFWCSFAAGFILPPCFLHLFLVRTGSKSAG